MVPGLCGWLLRAKLLVAKGDVLFERLTAFPDEPRNLIGLEWREPRTLCRRSWSHRWPDTAAQVQDLLAQFVELAHVDGPRDGFGF